jgi:hypothetical protein
MGKLGGNFRFRESQRIQETTAIVEGRWECFLFTRLILSTVSVSPESAMIPAHPSAASKLQERKLEIVHIHGLSAFRSAGIFAAQRM